MAHTLSKIMQDAFGDLGRSTTFVATGGSSTTVVNSKLGDLPEPPQTDYCVGWGIIVVKDAGGAGASPEGRYSIITGYNADTFTYTFDTMTDGVASGDTVMLVDDLISIDEMVRIVNRAVQKIEVPLTDTSLTTVAGQTEYSLPVAYKQDRPILVEYQGVTGLTNNNARRQVMPVRVVQTAAGSAATLIIPELPSGRTLYITGIITHPELTSYSSALREEVHPDVADAAVVYYAADWLNSHAEGRSDFWTSKVLKAKEALDEALAQHPIWRPLTNYNTLPMWGPEDDVDGVPSPIYW